MTTPNSPVDFLQAAWDDPEGAFVICKDDEYGILIVPDAYPVVPEGHVMVVAREDSTDKLSDVRRMQLFLAATVVSEHLTRVFNPQRKIGICMWGNKAQTPHIHCFPRNDRSDGQDFFAEDRKRADDEQLRTTQQKLISKEFEEELRSRLEGLGLVA